METIQEKEKEGTKGLPMVQLLCSYCRVFGLQPISQGMLDDSQTTPGANLQAFKQLKRFNEGVGKWPFLEEEFNKNPYRECQRGWGSYGTRS